MSSYMGLVRFLVLLGVVFASGKPTQYVSDNLKNNLTFIADELKLTHPDVGTHPLFGSVIKSINNSCQRQTEFQLMNATLDVYMQIFSNILQHSHHHDNTHNSGLLAHLPTTKRSKVVSALEKLRKRMDDLKSHLSRHNYKSPEDVYSTLDNIKVDDPKVQRKALAEFLQVYQAASVVSYYTC